VKFNKKNCISIIQTESAARKFILTFCMTVIMVLSFLHPEGFGGTKYKTFEKKRDFENGECVGTVLTSSGNIATGKQVSEIKTDMLNIKEIWDIANAEDISYFGTSSPSGIFRLKKSGDSFEIIDSMQFSRDVKAISKLFYDKSKKKLLYASMPDGKIFVYPSKLLCQAPATYIYDILKYKDYYYAAAGPGGTIFKISDTGVITPFYKSKDRDVLTMAIYKNRLLAGGSGSGLLYSIPFDNPETGTIVVENFPCCEIKKIIVNSKIYAAVNYLKNAESIKNEPVQSGLNDNAASLQRLTNEIMSQFGAGLSNFSFEKFETQKPPEIYLKSAIYSIAKSKQLICEIENQGINDFAVTDDGIFIAPSMDPELLLYNNNQYISLFRTVSGPVQIINIADDSNDNLFATGNPVKFYTAKNMIKNSESVYISETIDFDNISKFGKPIVESEGNYKILFRAGNNYKPDALWTKWKNDLNGFESRFLQYKIIFLKPGTIIKKIVIPFSQINLKPKFKSLAVNRVSTNETNSDGKQENDSGNKTGLIQEGLKTVKSLEELQNRLTKMSSDKNQPIPTDSRIEKAANYKIFWNVDDPNADRLSYSIFYKFENNDWIKIKLDEIYENREYFWNTLFFPDGYYKIKVEASDILDNPNSVLNDHMIYEDILVDNTPPDIDVKSEGETLEINTTDKFNIIKNCEISANGGDWKAIEPADGIFDSKTEKFIIPKKLYSGNIAFRIFDMFNNFKVESYIFQ